MQNSDIHFSAKFAGYLAQQGILPAIVYHYRKYREQENYPFELKDRRIMKQSIYKGVCELIANDKMKFKNGKDLVAKVEAIFDLMWADTGTKFKDRETTDADKEAAEFIKKMGKRDKDLEEINKALAGEEPDEEHTLKKITKK